MLYLNQKLVDESPVYARQWDEVKAVRNQCRTHEGMIAAHVRNTGGNPANFVANEAAFLPDDAWRDIDETTKRVMRNDEGRAYMEDLMPLARTVNIGKTVHLFRQSSDAGIVQRSMSGQVADGMDKVTYTFQGHPVPIFSTGYGRNWREWLGMQSEGFDAIIDDQEAHVAAINQDMAQYVLNGDTGIVVQGYQGYGITNHPRTNTLNLGAGGVNPLNIDLTSDATTADAIEQHFTQNVAGVWDNNFIDMPVNYYVSPEIMRRFERSYTGASGFKMGTLKEFLMGKDRIGNIKRTYELTGNQYFAFVPNSMYIRPLVGMAVSTTAIPRQMMTDDYNFRVMGAMGLEIRSDANNRSGVLYAADLS